MNINQLSTSQKTIANYNECDQNEITILPAQPKNASDHLQQYAFADDVYCLKNIPSTVARHADSTSLKSSCSTSISQTMLTINVTNQQSYTDLSNAPTNSYEPNKVQPTTLSSRRHTKSKVGNNHRLSMLLRHYNSLPYSRRKILVTPKILKKIRAYNRLSLNKKSAAPANNETNQSQLLSQGYQQRDLFIGTKIASILSDTRREEDNVSKVNHINPVTDIYPPFPMNEWQVIIDVIKKNDHTRSELESAFAILQMWGIRCAPNTLPTVLQMTIEVILAYLTRSIYNDRIATLGEGSVAYTLERRNLANTQSIAIMRAVNLANIYVSKYLLDNERMGLSRAASVLKMGDGLAQMRHQIAHDESLPNISDLQTDINKLRYWLWRTFWSRKAQWIPMSDQHVKGAKQFDMRERQRLLLVDIRTAINRYFKVHANSMILNMYAHQSDLQIDTGLDAIHVKFVQLSTADPIGMAEEIYSAFQIDNNVTENPTSQSILKSTGREERLATLTSSYFAVHSLLMILFGKYHSTMVKLLPELINVIKRELDSANDTPTYSIRKAGHFSENVCRAVLQIMPTQKVAEKDVPEHCKKLSVPALNSLTELLFSAAAYPEFIKCYLAPLKLDQILIKTGRITNHCIHQMHYLKNLVAGSYSESTNDFVLKLFFKKERKHKLDNTTLTTSLKTVESLKALKMKIIAAKNPTQESFLSHNLLKSSSDNRFKKVSGERLRFRRLGMSSGDETGTTNLLHGEAKRLSAKTAKEYCQPKSFYSSTEEQMQLGTNVHLIDLSN